LADSHNLLLVSLFIPHKSNEGKLSIADPANAGYLCDPATQTRGAEISQVNAPFTQLLMQAHQERFV
jgi:hypothetical protein